MENYLLVFIMGISLVMCSTPSEELPGPPEVVRPEFLELPMTQITFSEQRDYHSRWSRDGNKVAFARFDPVEMKTEIWMWNRSDLSVSQLVTGMTGDFSITWSPDDTRIAFDARDENDVSQIYILTIWSGIIEKFTENEENSFRPDWSHDGTSIIFVQSGSIYKKEILSGTVIRIENTDNGWNPSWNSDDSRIIFSIPNIGDDIYSVNPNGTNLLPLAQSFSSTETEVWPRWSPDNTRITYEWFEGENFDIAIKDLDSGVVNLITRFNDCKFCDWSSDGRSIVFAHDSNLWIVTMDD